MIGIYNAKTNELLERCDERNLESAIKDWTVLGYETVVGPAFKNLMLFSVK